jgi:hypothetical protein
MIKKVINGKKVFYPSVEEDLKQKVRRLELRLRKEREKYAKES